MKKSSLLVSLGSAAALAALTGCASSSGAEKADAPAATEEAAPVEVEAEPAAEIADEPAYDSAEEDEAGAEASCGEGSCG